MEVNIIGIDLAKNIMHVLKRTLRASIIVLFNLRNGMRSIRGGIIKKVQSI